MGRNKAPSLPIKALSFCRPTELRGKGGGVATKGGKSHRRWLIDVMLFMPYDIESQSRNADFISIAPKGETTHYILRVASAPSSSAVTDSLDFRVADAPLQIQFA